MDLCLMIEGQEGVSWPQWRALAEACEQHGIPTLFRSDHYLNLDGQHPERGSLDAWGTINALAAVTTTLRLGTLVSPAELPPSLGARQARGDRRPRVGRTDRSRPRRRLARARARGLRLSVPADRRTRRRARRAASDPDGDVGRRAVLVPGRALRPVRPGRPAQARPAAAPARDHGRQRGPAQRRARRALRRRVQHPVPLARGRAQPARHHRAGVRAGRAGSRSRSRR